MQNLRKYLPVQAGFIYRWGSAWIGAHYAPYNKRLCLNLLPCCTIWCIWEGGASLMVVYAVFFTVLLTVAVTVIPLVLLNAH